MVRPVFVADFFDCFISTVPVEGETGKWLVEVVFMDETVAAAMDKSPAAAFSRVRPKIDKIMADMERVANLVMRHRNSR